jgi:hypothetical protein
VESYEVDHRKRLLSLSAPIIDNILGFHAMTGCDTISLILGLESKNVGKFFNNLSISIFNSKSWQRRFAKRHRRV